MGACGRAVARSTLPFDGFFFNRWILQPSRLCFVANISTCRRESNEDCGRIHRSKFRNLFLISLPCCNRKRWFPREWKPAELGESVCEGGVIERQSSSRYVYRAQRHHPTRPDILAEQTETVFSSAEDAARHYLKWDLNLPGKLDGWVVVP